MRLRRALIALAVLLVALPLQSRAATPPVGETTVFAHVGAPGMPEGVAVHDGIVYTGTHTSVLGNAGGPASKIFTFDLATGASLGEFTIQGQDLSETHGVLAMAFDASGRLYVIDRSPGRVLRIDPTTGEQSTYATIPDLPACALEAAPCGPGAFAALPTFADFLVFAPDGTLYVTEFNASTIFRVPPGGGPAELWFQDSRLDSLFGANGIAVDPAGTTFYFAMTGSIQPDSPAQGLIYTLPIGGAPTATDLKVFHTFLQPASGPDGIAFGATGRLYVALAGANQMAILNPDGTEAAIFPDAVAGATQEIPFDSPASIAFDGDGSILVTNQSYFAANADHWALLRSYVGDTALPLIEPAIN